MRDIVVIAHDIRSTHNVGSLLRTAEGIGVSRVYFSGYTPYPTTPHDSRLPYIHEKLSKQIHKTALGAENIQKWEFSTDITKLIKHLQAAGYAVYALEQTPDSLSLSEVAFPDKVALLLGREVEGVDIEILKLCDKTIEIPMFGTKESFNVVQAAAMALYQIRFS